MRAMRLGLIIGITVAAFVVLAAVSVVAWGYTHASPTGSADTVWHLRRVGDTRPQRQDVDVSAALAEITFQSHRVTWMDGLNWCEGRMTSQDAAYRIKPVRCTAAPGAGAAATPGEAVAAFRALTTAESFTLSADGSGLTFTTGTTRMVFTP
jgi:hypothetical protein